MVSPLVRRRRLAAELTCLRDEHGYSSARLATEIGVARQRISEMESGHVVPNLEQIGKILQFFGVSMRHGSRRS